MKKIFMIVMLLLTTGVSYGEEVSNENSTNEDCGYIVKPQTQEMYDFKNFNLLSYDDMSGLTIDQKYKVIYLMKEFDRQMEGSFKSKHRKKRAMGIINRNIKEMSYVLDAHQYRNYLRILNVELNRRGIDLL